MKRIAEEFSGNFDVMRVLMHEPRLCTLHELQTIYSLEDFYFFLEMIDVQDTMKEEQMKKNKPAETRKR